MSDTPPYVEGHGLLAGKRVVVTAGAGTGIGFATAKRCVEEAPPSCSRTPTNGDWPNRQPSSAWRPWSATSPTRPPSRR